MKSHCWLCDYAFDYHIAKEKKKHDSNHKRMAGELFALFKDIVDHQRRGHPVNPERLSQRERRYYELLIDLGFIRGQRAIID